MKSKFANFVMNLIILLIIGILIFLGMVIYQEILGNNDLSKLEDYKPKEEIIKEENKNQNISISQSNSNNLSERPIPETPKKENSNNIISQNKNYKFFYNQLNKYSKIIYDALEKNKEQMKNGKKQIELRNSFTELLKQENGSNLLERYYQSAIETYLADNPEVFYIKPTKLYLNIETITKWNKVTYNVYINSGKNSNYYIDEIESQEQLETKISQIEKIRNKIVSQKTGNTYKDIKMVHDYLIKNVEYDTTISKQHIYNIYGTLINKKSVCEGYAKSFKYLLDNLDIPTVVVIGKALDSEEKMENHAWNYVKIDGRWYGIDVTWDDPIIIGNGNLNEESKYRYFLKGRATLENDHEPIGMFTQGGEIYQYPALSLDDYNF